jgi:hypothetical protein
MTQTNPSSDADFPEETPVTRASIESVLAESLHMHQSMAQRVESGEAEIQQSAVLGVKAEHVTANGAMLGFVQTPKAAVQNSAVGALKTENAYINGVVGAVAANSVEFGNAYAGVVAGREVKAQRVESIVLLAGHVEGEVHTVVDTRGAVIAGLLGGLFAGLILLLGRMVFRRK